MSKGEQTLEQQRAAAALRKVRELREAGAGRYGNYRSYVERLPAQIVMNGLGQAVATVRARASGDSAEARAYALLHGHMQGWLCRNQPLAPYRGAGDLIEAITTCDQDTYVRAHAEALAYLVWLKKFARAYLERGKDAD